MEVPLMQFPPGDPRVVDKIASQLKSQGIFDKFRKECISDVDTKPAYQNLHQRVEGTVASFLANQEWRPDLNKNQLRDSLRKHIHESGFLDIGVERIVDQVVNPKIMTVFLPQIEDVVYKCLGLEKPKKGKETQTGSLPTLPSPNISQKIVTLKDLLPTDLDPISPESDGIKDGDELSEDEKENEHGNEEEEEGGYDEDEEGEEEEEGGEEEEEEEVEEEEEEKAAEEEEISPPFEPIEEINSQCDESSSDSHLSGISDLTSHDSQLSNTSFGGNMEITLAKYPIIDLANHDSQLSKVSSGSRLSIVFSDDQEKLVQKPPSSPPEIDIINDESQLSKSSLQILSQESQASDNGEMSNQGSEESKGTDCIIVKDSSSDASNLDTTSSSKSLNIVLCENDQSKVVCKYDPGDVYSIKTDSNEKCSEIEKEAKKHTFERDDRVKSLDQKEEKKRSRVGSESGELKKNEHERRRSDKYRRDRSESKRSSRHDDKDRSDDKIKRDGGKAKESEKDSKKDKIRTDTKTEKEKNKLEEREDVGDKHKHAERIETGLYKNKSRNGADSDREESADAGDKNTPYFGDNFEKNGEKFRSEDLFGEEELKHENSVEKEGGKKEDKSRHKSKYEDKKERERNKDRESTKGKGRHDDRSSKDKSRHEDKLEKEDGKENRVKNDKDKSKMEDKVEKEGRERSRYDSKSEKESSKEKSKHEEKDGNKQKIEEKSDKYRHDRSKHSEKGDRASSKDRVKHDAKHEKERRSDDKAKGSSDKLSKEKKDDTPKTDEVDGDKKEKSRSEIRKDKTSREKSRHDDRGRSKSNSRHKDSTRTDGKDDGSSRNEKSSRDRSANRDSKGKTKNEGKESENRREEKSNKDKNKTEEKDGREKSSKSQNKGKENHDKKVDRKRDDSDSGKSSRSSDHKSKDAKKKEGKSKSIVDDHHIHRDKNSDDRRSTDRDSSGTQRSRPVGSRRSGSDTHSSHRHDKRDSNSSSGNNRSDGGGNSESAAEFRDDSSDYTSMETPVSPPSSLPFKKRPVQNQISDNDPREEYSCTMNAGKLILKSKKPRFAANIFEAKKLMHLRKSMAKIERRRQKEWKNNQNARRNAERRSDSDVENDMPSEVSLLELRVREKGPESDDEPFLFFNEEERYAGQDFIHYVQKLEKSETLSQVSWNSSDENDSEMLPQTGYTFSCKVTLKHIKESSAQDDQIQKVLSSDFVESNDNVNNTNEPLLVTSKPFFKSASNSNELNESFDVSSDLLLTKSSSSIKSTCNKRSKMEHTSTNAESHFHFLQTSNNSLPEREKDLKESSLTDVHTVRQENGNVVQILNSMSSGRTSRNSESSVSGDEPICKQSMSKFNTIHSDYTVVKDRGYSIANDLVGVTNETSPGHNVDFTESVDSSDDEDYDDDEEEEVQEEEELINKNKVKVVGLDSAKSDYSYIRDNNNIDKSSSDDEKCGEGMALSNELILPALRDLILESGFQLGDGLESAECLATASGMPTPDSQGEMSEKQSSAGSAGSTSNPSERKRPRLGRSRRVGLGKPHPSKRLNVGKKVATPAVAPDFVMPLSPESDVSASSTEQIRKEPEEVKADAPSISEVAEGTNFSHLGNDSEERRLLRSSSAGTPARRSQDDCNEDLFKPRPLFVQHKGQPFSTAQLEEPVVNCVGKRRRSTVESDGPQTSKRMRR